MLRALVRSKPWGAALIIVAALTLRLFLPAGFMPTTSDSQIVVSICTGSGPAEVTIDLPGYEQKSDGNHGQKSCAFADLSLPALASIAPVLLAELIAFTMAVGLTIAIVFASRDAHWMRPPLRGPPLSA